MRRLVAGALVLIGAVLLLDQVYIVTFGLIPFGGFLGDLSHLDPSPVWLAPFVHHWMLGLVLMLLGGWLYR